MTEIVNWSEGMKFPKHRSITTISAETFQPSIERLFGGLLPATVSKYGEDLWDKNAIQIGEYQFWRKEFPVETMEYPYMFAPKKKPMPNRLLIYRSHTYAHVQFSDTVQIPVLTRDGQWGKKETWMSYTPMEVFSTRGGIRKAKGKVLMAGMGLGFMARRVLERRQVEHLTVLERDVDVLRYFGKPLQEEFPNKLTLFCTDAWEYVRTLPFDRFDSYLWDIWASYGTAYDDPKWIDLRTGIQYANKTAWAWGDVSRLPEI